MWHIGLDGKDILSSNLFIKDLGTPFALSSRRDFPPVIGDETTLAVVWVTLIFLKAASFASFERYHSY